MYKVTRREQQKDKDKDKDIYKDKDTIIQAS